MKRILGVMLICLAASAALADDSSKLPDANNRFAFDLLNQLAAGQPTQNIFISPFSASTALQMLANGAKGKTKSEIESALKTQDLPPNEINADYAELNQSLLSQSDVDLALANSIWFESGLQLKPSFVSTNENFFQAKLDSVNFETPEAADTINKWARKNTHGKIDNVVSFPFPAATQVVLANAIYFKGKWKTPFDPTLTQNRFFYLANNTIKQTPMMLQAGTFSYEEGADFQAIELPYTGDRLEMVLFLPATNSSPQKLLAQFMGQNLDLGILQGLSDREGTIIFPKFKMDYNIELNAPLQALGMQQAFVPGSADFSGIADEPLSVSEVTQKSYVDVDEEGTEAAAVTTIEMKSLAMPARQRPFHMLVDRPFLFTISDWSSGAILFIGIVNDPTAD
jgi:serpin B